MSSTAKDVSANLAKAVAARSRANAKQADVAIGLVTNVVRDSFAKLIAIARKGGNKAAVKRAAAAALVQMVADTEAAVENELLKGAARGWDSAYDLWADNLPAEWWKWAFSKDPEVVLLESVEFDFDAPDVPAGRSKSGKRAAIIPGVRRVKPKPKPKPAPEPEPPTKVEKQAAAKIKAKPPAAAPPPTPKTLPKGQKVSKAVAAKVKAKTRPSREGLRALVRSRGWKSRMRKWSKKVTDLDAVAEIIADGVEKGKSIEWITKRVKPHVQNYAASARRLVRTEIAALENKQLEQTFALFDDIISGYQIINPLDERTRPAHAIRAGRIYWKDGRQKYKASERPELPDAANCRCTYAPILTEKAPAELQKGPKPDPRTYAGWFNNQPDEVKRKVVGAARWDAMKAKNKRPSWYDAVDPKTGGFMAPERIRKETPRSAQARRKKLKAQAEVNKAEARKGLAKYTPPVTK